MLKYAKLLLVLIALTGPAQYTHAQSDNSSDQAASEGLTLTVFRSPATGLEYRIGHVSAYAGFYPTIFQRDGKARNTNFIRLGVMVYRRPTASSFYISSSYAISLTDGWDNSILNEIGYRWQVSRRFDVRGGGVVLVTERFDEVRLNPSIGFGYSF